MKNQQDQQDQQDQHGINVLEKLRQLILLSADEHGEGLASHSVDLLAHIERTLKGIRDAQGADDEE